MALTLELHECVDFQVLPILGVGLGGYRFQGLALRFDLSEGVGVLGFRAFILGLMSFFPDYSRAQGSKFCCARTSKNP